jgi:predicted HTH domain antitoxin
MPVPDYLTYFFRNGQVPFQTICDLDESEAQAILRRDTLWRGDGTYLSHRKRHERLLRKKFVAKGGKPVRQHPIYMILGDCPQGPHDLHREYDYKIILPVALFSPDDISFTYPDSLYEVPLDDLGRLYLDRNVSPVVYRLEEIRHVIEMYQVYKYNHHYVEAQVWNDEPTRPYADPAQWSACKGHR